MRKQYHILNGDSLKEQFPVNIQGGIIVARECLVDGEVKNNNLEELYRVRAKFITKIYSEYSVQKYYIDSVTEFEKIRGIPKQSTVHLWFEDDLFCQVNFWFVVFLLFNYVQDCEVFLVRPNIHTEYGFGGLNESELIEAYNGKVPIIEMDKIASLWNSYQSDDPEKLTNTAIELKVSFPFILQAVDAHIARIPTKNNPGRPVQALMEIMNDLETIDFAPVFKEFNKRESIYGYGDLQVKRLFDEIRNKR